jgi:hypothetical protein
MEIGGFLEFPELQDTERKESAYYYLTNLYDNYDFFGDGRQAIKAVLLNIEEIQHKTCHLPAYLCDSILQSFRELELDVKFYPHRELLKPVLNGNIKDSLVYLIDYFGIEPVSEKEIEELLDDNNIVILDVSHSILDENRFSLTHENFYRIASIRKTFPIPDGGIVYHSDPNFKSSNIPPRKYETKLEAMLLRKLYLKGYDMDGSDKKGVKEHFLNLNQEYESYKYGSVVEPQSIPLTSCYILKNISITDIMDRRWENLSFMHEKLANKEVLLFNLDKIKSPFILTLKFKNENERDFIRKKLIENDVYPPVLWDLKAYIPEEFTFERTLSKRILMVPTDQRFGATEMSKVKDILNSAEMV